MSIKYKAYFVPTVQKLQPIFQPAATFVADQAADGTGCPVAGHRDPDAHQPHMETADHDYGHGYADHPHADNSNKERPFGVAAATEDAGNHSRNRHAWLSESLDTQHCSSCSDDPRVPDEYTHKLWRESVETDSRNDSHRQPLLDTALSVDLCQRLVFCA